MWNQCSQGRCWGVNCSLGLNQVFKHVHTPKTFRHSDQVTCRSRMNNPHSHHLWLLCPNSAVVLQCHGCFDLISCWAKCESVLQCLFPSTTQLRPRLGRESLITSATSCSCWYPQRRLSHWPHLPLWENPSRVVLRSRHRCHIDSITISCFWCKRWIYTTAVAAAAAR